MDSLAKDKEGLISGIEADAKDEAAKILEDARKQADEKTKYTAKKIESILAEARENAQKQAETVKSKIISDVELEIKRRFLRLRNTIMQDIIVKVEGKLNSMIGDGEYRDVLMNWITEAAVGLGVDSAKINASEKEMALMDEKFLSEVSEKIQKQTGRQMVVNVSEGRALESQGVVLTTEDGRMAFDNQVKTRLSRKQRQVRTMIYNELFTDDKDV